MRPPAESARPAGGCPDDFSVCTPGETPHLPPFTPPRPSVPEDPTRWRPVTVERFQQRLETSMLDVLAQYPPTAWGVTAALIHEDLVRSCWVMPGSNTSRSRSR